MTLVIYFQEVSSDYPGFQRRVTVAELRILEPRDLNASVQHKGDSFGVEFGMPKIVNCYLYRFAFSTPHMKYHHHEE